MSYWLVTNPLGKTRTYLAIDYYHAIQMAVSADKYKFFNSEYTAIKSKI